MVRNEKVFSRFQRGKKKKIRVWSSALASCGKVQVLGLAFLPRNHVTEVSCRFLFHQSSPGAAHDVNPRFQFKISTLIFISRVGRKKKTGIVDLLSRECV